MKKSYKSLLDAATETDANQLPISRLLELQSVLFSAGILSDSATITPDANFWENLEKRYPTHYVEAFKFLTTSGIEYNKNCFDKDAIESNQWLLDELKKIKIPLGTIFLCAGWYATLTVMIFEHKLNVTKVRSFDLDPTAITISEIFNRPWVIDNWKFKAAKGNIADIDFDTYNYDVLRSNGTVCNLTDSPDTVINTYCEHTQNSTKWYSNILGGTLVILQASNQQSENQPHVFNSFREFDQAFPTNNLLYCDEKQLSNYTKYMKIGFK